MICIQSRPELYKPFIFVEGVKILEISQFCGVFFSELSPKAVEVSLSDALLGVIRQVGSRISWIEGHFKLHKLDRLQHLDGRCITLRPKKVHQGQGCKVPFGDLEFIESFFRNSFYIFLSLKLLVQRHQHIKYGQSSESMHKSV